MSGRRAWSLRRTLLSILLALTMAVWSGGAAIVYYEADRESAELFDQSLQETAHLLLTLAEHEVEERRAANHPDPAESAIETRSHLRFQIWDAQRRLLYKNQGAPDAPFAPDGASGYGSARLDGQLWRTYALWNDGRRLQIQVGEPGWHRKEISHRFAYKLLLFALAVAPLMAAAIWWAVNRVFRALRDSADEVSRRTPDDLREVNLAGAPAELHSLLHALNRLFGRVARAREREQRFTADASHELRTPLAAIKTNLQVIQRARNEAERAEAAAGLAVGVERATRLVEQLMTLSRLDPQSGADPQLAPLDLAALLAAQTAALARQAGQHGVAFGARLEPAACLANRDSLLILLRNLTDNAIRYTPRGGRVELACWSEGATACLRVADTGAGIPPAMRERVFERFFRLPGTPASGSGLGLSIVRHIADTHQAELRLADGLDGAGLAVELRLPGAAATPPELLRTS